MNALCDSPLFLPRLEDDYYDSLCSFSVLSGEGLSIWGPGLSGQEARHELQLQISPDYPVIIGRTEREPVPYLDPSYQSTTIFPGTGDTILRSNGEGRDRTVSRAHFMLRASTRGILVVNGVPKPGGGLRSPLNGTRMMFPNSRQLEAEEELVVESGDSIMLMLPNSTTLRIVAE